MNALDKIIEAHGGLARWHAFERIELEASISGFLFTAKRVPVLDHARIVIHTRHPETTIHDHPRPGQVTRFHGPQLVEVVSAEGKVLQFRGHPRVAFGGLRRQLWWDALDFAYFSGYAMWNYLTFPFLLTQPGVQVLGGAAGPDGGTTLSVKFPRQIPTHCERQVFHFDARGLLRRHDYTAEVVGHWAHAAHLCDEYREFDGIRLPTRRRVHPTLLGSRPLRFVTLVAIDIHHARFT